MALSNEEKLRLARKALAIQPDHEKAETRNALEKYVDMDPEELADEIARLEEATGGATGASAVRLGKDASPDADKEED